MLNGRTVLIVEAEFLIALDIQRMLEALEVGQTLFARTATEALDMRAAWPDIALAVVEIRVNDAANEPLARQLRAGGIAVVLTTAELSGWRRGPSALPDLPVLLKPVREEDMASAVQQALAVKA